MNGALWGNEPNSQKYIKHSDVMVHIEQIMATDKNTNQYFFRVIDGLRLKIIPEDNPQLIPSGYST